MELVLAFEQLGRAALPGPLIETVAVVPSLLTSAGAVADLPKIAAGELLATVAIPPFVPFAVDADAAGLALLLADGDLHRSPAVTTQRSIDPTRSLSELGRGEVIGSLESRGPAMRAYDLGALACSAQVLGLGTALVEMSTTYAGQRIQFGRPVGSFQAVKHLLADAHVGLELARPLVYGAALSVGTPEHGRDVSAAKVACSEAAYRASRAALQVHGAIGYTAEFDLSLWLTKVRALYSAWGTVAQHRRRVLAELVSPGSFTEDHS